MWSLKTSLKARSALKNSVSRRPGALCHLCPPTGTSQSVEHTASVSQWKLVKYVDDGE